jgi:hypothetical protein
VELYIYSPNTPSWRGAQLKEAQGQLYLFTFIIIIIIIITFSYQRFPFPWYFSSTSGTPHHLGFKFQFVALSLLCAMSLVQLFVVRNVLNVILVLFTGSFQSFSSSSRGPNCYRCDEAFHVPH